MNARYDFRRGETLSLALDAMSGDPGTVTSISANLRKMLAGATEVDPDAPVAAVATVTSRAAVGSEPAGWTLTISSTDTLALETGTYALDARLVVAGGVIITTPAIILIKEPATLS